MRRGLPVREKVSDVVESLESRGRTNAMKSSMKILMFSMLGVLAIFGGALVYFTMEYLSFVVQGDSPPTPETIHQISLMILVVTMMAGMPSVGMGAYVMYIGSRIRVTGQWPPAGMGYTSKMPVMLGVRGNVVGLMTMGFGGILVVVGLLLPLLGWRMVNVFFPDF